MSAERRQEIHNLFDGEGEEEKEKPEPAASSSAAAPGAKRKAKREPKQRDDKPKPPKRRKTTAEVLSMSFDFANENEHKMKREREPETFAKWKLKDLGLWNRMKRHLVTEAYEVVGFSWASSAQAFVKELQIEEAEATRRGLSWRQYLEEIEKALQFCQMELSRVEKEASIEAQKEEVAQMKREQEKQVESPRVGRKHRRKYMKKVVYKTDNIPIQHEEKKPETKHAIIEWQEKEEAVKQSLAFFISELNTSSSICMDYTTESNWNRIPQDERMKILSAVENDLRKGKLSKSEPARASFFRFKEFMQQEASSTARQRWLNPTGADIEQFLSHMKKEGAATAASHHWNGFRFLSNYLGFRVPEKFAGLKGLTKRIGGIRNEKQAVSPRIIWIIEKLAAEGCEFCAAAVAASVAGLRCSDAQRVVVDWLASAASTEYWAYSCYDSKTESSFRGKIPLMSLSGYEWWKPLARALKKDPKRDYLFAVNGEFIKPDKIIDHLVGILQSHGIVQEDIELFCDKGSHSFRRFLTSLAMITGETEADCAVIGLWKNCTYKSLPIHYSDSRLTKLIRIVRRVYATLRLWHVYRGDEMRTYNEDEFLELVEDRQLCAEVARKMELTDRVAVRFALHKVLRL